MALLSLKNGWAAAAVTICACLGAARAADEIHWTITGQTSVSLDWRGTTAEDYVRYGMESGVYTGLTIAQTPSPMPFSSPGPFWEAEITGLAEDTLYYYSIADGPEHTFRTPPPAGISGFTIYAEGDIGDVLAYPRVGIVQDLIAAGKPAFVLVAGDLTYGNDHGQDAVDQHFNDVMVWSRDAAYMAAWGNHEWDQPRNDDLRNYKGRFDFPNPQTSPTAPSAGCCGEDWYWFDYGDVRFIAYPEPYSGSGDWYDWMSQADVLMAEAEADPDIDFIVTWGHRPAYSAGTHDGSGTLRDILDELGTRYAKYVLNVNGHSHDYERSFPQNGVVHVTVGTGGSTVGLNDPDCRWSVCPAPSWTAFRAVHTGALRLDFSKPVGGNPAIDGSFICGGASSMDDVDCAVGEVIDTFSIGSSLPPDSIIVSPAEDTWIMAGEEVLFEGDATDPDGDLPLSFLWDFGGGAENQTVEDPGSVVFAVPGVYTVTFTATDSLGRSDPTPDSRTITVSSPDGRLIAEAYVASSYDDAEEQADGEISISSTDLEMVRDGTDQTVGMRFGGLAVPRGSAIVDAYVQFQVDETATTETTLRIQGEATDDALDFDWTPFGISFRPRTAAEVWWTPPSWTTVGEAGPEQQTPNIAPVIQEITGRPGWINGNALVLIVTGIGERVAESYDGDSGAAPRLFVEYTPPSSGNLPPSAVIDDPPSNVTVAAPASVNFAGTGTDPDGNLPLTYLWDFGGAAPTRTVEDPGTIVFDTPGVYTVTFTVTDSLGLSDHDWVTVTVTGTENTAPSVNIASPPNGSSFAAGETVNFLGSADDAEDGDLTASLSWVSSLDGLIGSGGSFSASSLSVGTHLVTATATDGLGLSGSDQITVTIAGEPEAMLVTSPSGSSGYETSGGRYGDKHLTVIVTLVDGNGAPVRGASVSATVSGPVSESGGGTTDVAGQMSIAIHNAPPGVYSTEVTSVSADGYVWDGATPPNSFVK